MRPYLLIFCLFPVLSLASCLEDEKISTFGFVSTPFDKNRTTVGEDQVEPLKAQILSHLQSKTISYYQISLISSSSKAPYYTTLAGKKVLDPKSDEKNLSLARDREMFAMKVLAKAVPKNIKIESKSTLSGPDFHPLDLNTRFVTSMTPGFTNRVEDLWSSNKRMYESVAVMKKEDLLNEKEYPSLYQVKFKPFQGFYFRMKGVKKCRAVENKPDSVSTQ